MTMAYIMAAFSIRPYAVSAFHTGTSFVCRNNNSFLVTKLSQLRMSTSASSSATYVQKGISRIETLQTLLSKHGAPGSSGCAEAGGDLQPITILPFEELVKENKELLDLHPHLYPLAKSQSTGNYICALRRPSSSDDETDNDESPIAPMPIVEGGLNMPGMKLLALNSELLMRRIAAEADFTGGETGEEIVSLYNEGLGEGKLTDAGLDTVYEAGSVEKLGYGPEKYVLLRVGPFPDLYESMSLQHISRKDESSALIAAEASNGKFTGFGCTFAFYAKLLSTLPNRDEETKDAARVCLRLPLSSVAMSKGEMAKVGRYAALATEDDGDTETLEKMLDMYEKIRKHEQEENSDSGKTAEQIALDEANYVLDKASLTGKKWSDVREELASIYKDAEKENMASFVNPSL